MTEFKFINNAKEEFNLFLNEDNEPCLNVSIEKELLAGFIMQEEELDSLIDKLKEIRSQLIRE